MRADEQEQYSMRRKRSVSRMQGVPLMSSALTPSGLPSQRLRLNLIDSIDAREELEAAGEAVAGRLLHLHEAWGLQVVVPLHRTKVWPDESR